MTVRVHVYDGKGNKIRSYDARSYDAGNSIGGRRAAQTRRQGSVDVAILDQARSLGLTHGRRGMAVSSPWADETPYYDAYMSGYKSARGSRDQASEGPTSEAQRRAMWAASQGRSNIGIPRSIGKEFAEADPGGKLPQKK